MKYIITLLLVATLLTGCADDVQTGGKPNPPPVAGKVNIKCADLVNEGGSDRCRPVAASSFWPQAHAAVTIIDAGVVSRSASVEATITVANNTGAAWQGQWGMTFDAGCNGAATWELAPPQATPTIAAGAEWTTTAGGGCGDMPTGARTLTATLYEADGITAADVVEVRFQLVE